MSRILHIVGAFSREEDGASLAEYLVLLGVLTAAVVVGVGAFGNSMGTAFTSWSTWITANANAP
jgi:pilus assembly protein Flp/PilA